MRMKENTVHISVRISPECRAAMDDHVRSENIRRIENRRRDGRRPPLTLGEVVEAALWRYLGPLPAPVVPVNEAAQPEPAPPEPEADPEVIIGGRAV